MRSPSRGRRYEIMWLSLHVCLAAKRSKWWRWTHGESQAWGITGSQQNSGTGFGWTIRHGFVPRGFFLFQVLKSTLSCQSMQMILMVTTMCLTSLIRSISRHRDPEKDQLQDADFVIFEPNRWLYQGQNLTYWLNNKSCFFTSSSPHYQGKGGLSWLRVRPKMRIQWMSINCFSIIDCRFPTPTTGGGVVC